MGFIFPCREMPRSVSNRARFLRGPRLRLRFWFTVPFFSEGARGRLPPNPSRASPARQSRARRSPSNGRRAALFVRVKDARLVVCRERVATAFFFPGVLGPFVPSGSSAPNRVCLNACGGLGSAARERAASELCTINPKIIFSSL